MQRTAMMVVALVAAMTANAFSAQADTTLANEMAALKAEVAQMRAQQNQSWLTERRAEEVKTLIGEVLADADTRASLLDSSLTAGHNGNFFLASADGNFLLKVAGQIQVRWVWNSVDDDTTLGNDVDGDVAGFEIRRGKLKFKGHIGDPKIKYSMVLANGRGDSSTYLEEAKVSYTFDNGITLGAGRMKAPFLREELTSSSKQLAVERTYVNEMFTAGFVEGVTLSTNLGDNFKLNSALTDGAGSGENGSQGAVSSSADWATTIRLDWKVQGEWSQMDDFTAWSGEGTAIFVGGAIHYEVGETGTKGPVNPVPPPANFANNDNFFAWTVDASAEFNNISLYGAVVSIIEDTESGSEGTAYGYILQGSYNINDKFEPFVRYENVNGDGEMGIFSDLQSNSQLVTFGANYYIKKHDAKFTVDVVWALDSLASGESGLGLRESDEDDQWAIRAQFQLLF